MSCSAAKVLNPGTLCHMSQWPQCRKSDPPENGRIRPQGAPRKPIGKEGMKLINPWRTIWKPITYWILPVRLTITTEQLKKNNWLFSVHRGCYTTQFMMGK